MYLAFVPPPTSSARGSDTTAILPIRLPSFPAGRPSQVLVMMPGWLPTKRHAGLAEIPASGCRFRLHHSHFWPGGQCWWQNDKASKCGDAARICRAAWRVCQGRELLVWSCLYGVVWTIHHTIHFAKSPMTKLQPLNASEGRKTKGRGQAKKEDDPSSRQNKTIPISGHTTTSSEERERE